ncbi:MAG TPA: alpha-galactosidase [Anaerolineae bacterium]|nr:alpha-galactosidase [Anaerolineae bacterium]HQK12985.1 alpha-galactosidase [Anaerolineae bacterium]
MTLLFQSPCFEFWWESQQGVFRLQSPGRALRCVAGIEVVQRGRVRTLATDKLPAGRVVTECTDDVHGQAMEATLSYQEVQGLALSLYVRVYPTRPFVLLKIAVTNVGPEPTWVRRFFISTTPDGFQATESPTGFYVNGWQSWSTSGFVPLHKHDFVPLPPVRWLQGPMIHNALTPWIRQAGRLWSETVGAVITPREALVAGAASLADQFVQVYANIRPAHNALTVQSQADDVPLEVGEGLTSEWFYLEWVPLPTSDPFAQYAYAVIRQMQLPTPRPAPTGWCSWYMYGNRVDEEDIIHNMAAAALLADEMPLQVIQLDEGYQAQWGDWTSRNARFPHAFTWLTERIRGSGFTPGLWLGPLTVHPRSRLATEHPDWLLRTRQGRPVSPGLISGFMAQALDPTHPEVQAHIHDLVAQAVHEWGFPYLKLDFMYAGALPGKRYNARITRNQALRQIFRVIREAAGDDAYLVGCGAPLQSALGLVDAMRIGPDTAPAWDPLYGNVGRFMKHNPSLPGLRNSLRNVATRAWIHSRWWTNDPDTLMVRHTQTQLTGDEVLAQVTLIGLSGGLLLLSDDLESLPPERRALFSALLPPLLEGMDVLDLFQKEMPEEVSVPIARPWGHWRLVGLFNWTQKPIERTLPAELSLDKRKPYHLFDFWERRYLRIEPGALPPVFHLPPHGAALLGIRPVISGVHLVATTFHISQGAEITEWHAETNTLTLTLDIKRLARGEVWLALPARPKTVLLNDKPLSVDAVRAVASGVWAVTCYINHSGTLQIGWGAG